MTFRSDKEKNISELENKKNERWSPIDESQGNK